jgi:hypothetical protein
MTVSESELNRPSVFATVLWAVGIFTMGSAVCVAVVLRAWMGSFQDFLVILSAFTPGFAILSWNANKSY